MDRNPRVSTLVMLLHLTLYISGEMIPGNVTLHIWEGNVTVTWDPPQKNPVDCLYQVQLSDYSVSPGVWVNVSQCNLLQATTCNIGYLPMKEFRVRIGVLMTQNNISWSSKHHINIRNSQLFAPTFNLLSTSNSVRVKIHRKQMLGELFPYGVEYTAYLWPDGQENQTLTKSDDDIDDDGEMKFNLLQSLQVYCVCVKVESKATLASKISSVHCLKLLLDAKLMICFIFLGLLCIVAFLTLFICCYLKHPRKMPTALKPVVNGWRPMNIGPVQVETVTDKGWIVITNNADTKKQISEKKLEITEEDKERRESLDSGVSMEQLHLSVSNTKTDGQMGDIQGDSGCGSLKGTEGSGSVRRVTRELFSQRMEDSGLGLGHHEVSGSLEGEDSGLLSKVVVGDGYRSQSPSSVAVRNEISNMATPSGGYRSGQVTCMCSDNEYCIWCKFKKPFTEDCQPMTQAQTDFSQFIFQTDDGNSVISGYLKKNLLSMEVTTAVPHHSDINCAESSLVLLSCSLLLQNEKKQDSMMDTRSFKLDDVEVTYS